MSRAVEGDVERQIAWKWSVVKVCQPMFSRGEGSCD
jgi:hypothetical protein